MKRKKISIDIDESMVDRLDGIATLADRDRSHIIRTMLKNYINEIEACYTAIHRIENVTDDSSWHSVDEAKEIMRKRNEAKKGIELESNKTSSY